MRTNAYRTLRTSLAAAILLLCFASLGFSARTHVVRKGDSLSKIAKKYNTTVVALQRANKLKSSHLLHEGAILTVGHSKPAAKRKLTAHRRPTHNKVSAKPVRHVVAKGDSLYKIAKKYKTSVASLARINKLKPSRTLKDGEVLTIALSTPGSKPESTTYGRPIHSRVSVTSGPHVVAVVHKTDRFLILDREGDVFNVKLQDGRTGTVPSDQVKIEETRKPLPASDSYSYKGGVVRTALAFRGARYRSGGTGGRGFDCSGFVKYVYSAHGVKLPHSSSAQYSCGTPVARGSLRPGDIVFFAGTYRRGISHVGLYTGNGKFIHASTHRGGVRVDALDASYYRRRYAGARRLR